MNSLISSSLENIRAELRATCEKCGRDPSSVTLVAVSKKQPFSKIHEAYRQRHFDFGENYIQEALEKQQALSFPEIRWHLIGPVQSNKINKILGRFYLIHSVESLENAIEINKRAERDQVKTSVLLQVNLGGEESKSGQTKDELLKNWGEFQKLQFLKIKGLMTMPPLADDPELSRPYFRELKLLADRLHLKELSMGTTSDWKVAIEEGATLIRIGTAVFGERTK